MTRTRNERSWSGRLERLRVLVGCALAASLLVAGCASAPQPPAQPTPAPSPAPISSPPISSPPPEAPKPDVPPGLYPPDYRTGDAKVDGVIDAFMKKDVDRLMGMAYMRQLKCAKGTQAWCGPNEPDGTVGSYFAWGSCETTFLRDTQMIHDTMSSWVKESRYLFAAYSVQGMDPNAYYLIFASAPDDVRAKTVYLTADGKISDLGLGCNVPTPMANDHYKAIAAPRSK